MATTEEIAWLAGFYDADGTLALGGDPRAIRIHCNITQKDRLPIDWINSRFRGSITKERDRYWRWTPKNKEAFLRIVQPYLVLKRARVERLIRDYYELDLTRRGSTSLTPAQVQVRQEMLTWFRTQTLATVGKPSSIGGDANVISAL